MSFEETREKLRQDPETITLKLGGEERPFLISPLGFELAESEGHEVLPVIMDLGFRIARLWNRPDDEVDLLSDEGEKLVRDTIQNQDMHNISLIVWTGLLPFDEDLELREVKLMLTFSTMISELPKVVSAVMSFQEDALPEDIEQNGQDEVDQEEAEEAAKN